LLRRLKITLLLLGFAWPSRPTFLRGRMTR
jgi:hypothetical protein